MKIFGLFSNVTLAKKPVWLDAFRARYDEPYEYHITFKQPCYVQKEMISELKNKLRNFFSVQNFPEHQTDVVFDRLGIRPDAPKGGCIMIYAQRNPTLMKLQQDLREALIEYQNYLKPESSQWERDFKPHITIARHLSPERLEEAKRDLQEDLICVGSIDEIYLQIVDESNAEEAKKLENRTTFKL